MSVKLTAVNDKMAEYTNTPGTASLNAALMHTLQRHRDILQVCTLTDIIYLFDLYFVMHDNNIISVELTVSNKVPD